MSCPKWGLLCLWLFSSFSWAAETLKIESVDVAGARDEAEVRKDAGTQKLVFGRKEIESLSVMTAGEVISKLPGVEVGAGGARARGMSRDSIRVMIDGEKQSGGTMGAFSRMPASDIERVEIHRGSSAEFGGSSPLTVNIVLKKGVSKPSTEVKAALGFKDGEPNEQLSWSESGKNRDFSWVLPVSLNFSKSPANSSLRRNSSGISELEYASGSNEMGHHAFTPRLTWKSGRDSVTLSSMVFLGPSEKVTQTSHDDLIHPAYIRNANEDGSNRSLRLRLEGEKYFGESKLSGRFSINNRHNELDVTRVNNIDPTVTENTKSNEDEFASAARWDQPIDLHFVSLGVEYNRLSHQDSQLFGPAAFQYKSSSQDQVLWLQDVWTPQDRVTVTGGLRMENMAINSDGNSHQDFALLPSVAVRWQPQEAWVFRTSLGAGMKTPRLNEITATLTRSITQNTPLDADSRGNPNLKSEHSINFEAVAERYLAQKAGVLSANVYVRATSDFTERRLANELVAVNTYRWIERPYNEGDALHWGLELDGKLNTDQWGISGGTAKAHLTLPNARVDDARLGITRDARDTPRYVMSMGWDQSIPRWQSSMGISMQLSGRSETDIPGEQKAFTEARALLDAFWLYKLNPQFNLRVSAQNLLDEDMRRQNKYITPGDAWKLLANDFGYRTVMFSIEGRW